MVFATLSFSRLFYEKYSLVLISGAGCLDCRLHWLLCQPWCLSSCSATPCYSLPFQCTIIAIPSLFCSSALVEWIDRNDWGHLVMMVEVKNQKQQEHPSWKIYVGYVVSQMKCLRAFKMVIPSENGPPVEVSRALQDSVWCYRGRSWSDYQASSQSSLDFYFKEKSASPGTERLAPKHQHVLHRFRHYWMLGVQSTIVMIHYSYCSDRHSPCLVSKFSEESRKLSWFCFLLFAAPHYAAT